jgi:8-oxo-dGTP diphosphatase
VRTFPDRPFVGVGAVVLDPAGRVLLARRAHEPLLGEWSLPGGAVEIGEALEAAVARELLEETGLAVEVGPVVEVFDRIERASDGRVEYHFVIIDYLCRAVGDPPVSGSDAADVRWVRPDQLAAYRLTDKATTVINKAISLAASTGSTREPRGSR